jgi:hypothetical protein
MKAYEGVDLEVLFSFTSALVGGEWSAARPYCFTPGKEPPVSSGYEAGWASEPVWTAVEKRNF